MYKLLLIDDDKEVLTINMKYFKQLDYEVKSVSNARNALKLLSTYIPDCIVMDVMMPGMDGFSACTKIREICSVPIIFLTGRDSEDDKVQGLLLGADDYMVKPVNLDELNLRIGALLKRSGIEEKSKITVGDFILTKDEYSAFWQREEIQLTKREFEILFTLLSNPRKTFSRSALLDKLWDWDSSSSPRAIDVYMTKLRSKLEKCTSFEIVTVHGLGYKVIIK